MCRCAKRIFEWPEKDSEDSPSYSPLAEEEGDASFLEVLEKTGAGDWNRTSDLRFTNGGRKVFVTLGDASGFPVLTSQH